MYEAVVFCIAMNVLWALRSLYLEFKVQSLRNSNEILQRENNQLKMVVNLLAHECIEANLDLDEKKQYLEKCLHQS